MGKLRVIRSISVSAALLAAGFVWLAPVAQAADNLAVSRNYQVDGDQIVPGALVSSKAGNANAVELASMATASRLIGVVVTGSLVELSDGAKGVEVVTSGTTTVLVSDINGEVQSGDRITSSPISGVGMKATESAHVVGTAQAGMAGAAQDTRKVKDKAGKDQTVRIAQVPVRMGVSYFSANDNASLFVPPFLQALANNVGGEPISAVRVGAATLTVLLLFSVIFVVLRTTVRSSITAVGRNPLASDIVRRTVQEVGLTVTGLLIFGLLICYLILRI
jgi:hypothetical protein